MREALLFRGEVDGEGRFAPDERFKWLATLQREKGKRVEVTIRRERRFRSFRANRFLWGWVYPVLCEYTGYAAEELHEALKLKILGAKDTPFGPVAKGTKDLDPTEFAGFVERVRALAAEIGCAIPDPSEVA